MRSGGKWRGKDQQGRGLVGREGRESGRKEREEGEDRACYLWLAVSNLRILLPRTH